jgi:hypothetical protein
MEAAIRQFEGCGRDKGCVREAYAQMQRVAQELKAGGWTQAERTPLVLQMSSAAAMLQDEAGVMQAAGAVGVVSLQDGGKAGAAKAKGVVKDFATKNTKNWSAAFNSEGEARALARAKLGANPVEVEPNKWRSADGKWQYRAKPGDVADNHIHLEELNPRTGEVLQNLHLRWSQGAGR